MHFYEGQLSGGSGLLPFFVEHITSDIQSNKHLKINKSIGKNVLSFLFNMA